MKKEILLLILISFLILPIIGQQNENQKEGEGNMQDSQQNSSENKQESTINCNENGQNPNCMKEETSQLYSEMKSEVPGFIGEMTQQSEEFSQKNSTEQLNILNEKMSNFTEIQKGFENITDQGSRKEMVEKAIEIADLLTKKDCAAYVNESKSLLESSNNKDFNECREEKKSILTQIIEMIKNHFQCENITELIKNGMSEDKQENFKYILFLIYEASSNPDSIKKEDVEVLYNVTLCLEEDFQKHWDSLEGDLDEKNKTDIKQDVSLILIKSLANLVNILHYSEVDGYLDQNKNISDSGLMRNEQGIEIQKGIMDFAQQFHEFGNGTYNISNSMNISITKFDDVNDSKLLEVEQIYNLSDKGIYVSFKPRKMMNEKGGNTMQFIVYDSPLVSTFSNENSTGNNPVKDFISLSIFDEEGNEVNITDLPEDSRPIILYNKTAHKNLVGCMYYNDTNEDLDTNGLTTENYTLNGETYLKCSSNHLTSFTASSSLISETSQSSFLSTSWVKWLSILFIVIA